MLTDLFDIVEWIQLAQELLLNSCEHDNESSGPQKAEDF
jgi:hypothetical protein